MSISAIHPPSVARWRIGVVTAALLVNLALVIGSLSDEFDQVLAVAAISALPATLFALFRRPNAFRAVATTIGAFYVLLAVVLVYPIGYVPAGAGLLVVGLSKRRVSGRRLALQVVGGIVVLVILTLLLWWLRLAL